MEGTALINHYYTIEQPSTAEFRDRGSQFLAHAFPLQSVDDFKKRLKTLKAEHPKASHHCFAWRLGTDGNNYRSSDDGEPSGTAGRPILGQIDSRELTDAGLIVVRYFGGALLGVPGLINAYKTSASLALQLTPIIRKPVLVYYELEYDYTLVNDIMMVVKRFGCTVGKNEMQLFCRMLLGIPREVLEPCVSKLKDLHGVSVTLAALNG
ncbi:MAG TPA: YigZ family protein [Flavisolibacter sp.]|nr:YigZ family protein [Flavisolibacter sp.]